MYPTNCRYFNGYKPCAKSQDCSHSCDYLSIPSEYILIIHLGAIGAVVRATSLLPAIKRKYPNSHITWVTDAPSNQLLMGHPQIDRVLNSEWADILSLSSLNFDLAYVVDKSLKACGILKSTKAKKVLGFTSDSKSGAILPATESAQELWSLGLDNYQKFFVNKKPETQLINEALELGPWIRDEYSLPLSVSEASESSRRAFDWRLDETQPIIGINTGCSGAIPYKKLTIDYHRKLIQKILDTGYKNIVLLGGPEDKNRNDSIGSGLPIIQSSANKGLRDGLISVDACDIVISGDSLGMHMAIARKKYVVAWFGPTCSHEIDLYDRGQYVLSKAPCGPCWKRHCQNELMCYDQVDVNEILSAVGQGVLIWKSKNPSSSTKQLSSETSYLLSL